MSEPIPVTDPLQSELDKLLNEVSALAIRLRQDARRVQTVGDLPAGGVKVLRMLSRCPVLTVPQMARLDSTSRQNIQTVVNRLEREGCVESVPNPAHKRSDLVRITDRGMASLGVVSRNEGSYKDKLSSGISAEDLSRASELLRQLREAFCTMATEGEMPKDPPKPVRRTQGQRKLLEVKDTPLEENGLPVSLL